MEKGWKPLPAMLKIIWILLVIETFFAVLSISLVYNQGFEFMGFSLFGMVAINVFFFVKIVLPVILIIGIHQRYSWIWIAAILYYLIFVINGFACLPLTGEMQNKIMEQMPEVPEGISEDMYFQTIHLAIIASLIVGSLFNLAIMILIFVKRKYFTVDHHAEPPSKNDMPE